MKKRIFSLLLALIFIVGAANALVLNMGAEATQSHLDLLGGNLSFSDSVYLKFAAKATAPEDVKLLVWTAPQEEYTIETAESVITDFYVDDKTSYKVFDYKDLAAKQMTDVVYVCAYADGSYGKVIKYSILQYVYNKLGNTGTATSDEALIALLEKLLRYGAAAQKHFGYKADRLANDAWYQVKLTAGTLDDGFKQGLYLAGDVVTINAPETDEHGCIFSSWTDSTGAEVAKTAAYALTVGEKNEVYTPNYVAPETTAPVTTAAPATTAPVTTEAPVTTAPVTSAEPEMPEKPAGGEWPAASEGLEFDDDGEAAYLLGRGDFEGDVIVIPSVGPEGGAVVSIEANAFASDTLTAIYIPNTVTNIGRRAFNGCTYLTDVYYDGTEAEWEEVYVANNNTPLTGAQIHFKTEYFLVTFVDYNGRILKYEYVEGGNAAAAPVAPAREGYTFTGWDKSFDNVTADITVTATYVRNITEPSVIVEDAIANIGDKTVDVIISLENNPGLSSLKFEFTYDDSVLKLSGVEFGSALGGAMITTPEPYKNPQPITLISPLEETTASGVLATLTFEISEAVTAETVTDITVAITEAFDGNQASVVETFEAVNGSVTIK